MNLQRGEAGVFSGDVFKMRRELFQRGEGVAAANGATGRPSIGAGAGAARPAAASPGPVNRAEGSVGKPAVAGEAAAPAANAAAVSTPSAGMVSSLLSLVGLGSAGSHEDATTGPATDASKPA
jgi:hypothetical protein